ncbi:MAG: helix-turn-helix domain-containing protein [Nitrososphaerota archaeon]|jgi:DNA-binding MarR family transcriptional regulator|uniref:helix-turn-helix domain-containing protein n=1 Tax=Candidatus Bathycorpusculum sp. TaxID=2994959 RepID=UPI00282574C3|nr:helix-turn-helix domain-containing protein [Candidatus Termiticorpusculum sp.]MCL2257342.1 helix-turn-helix domain-containing protein [Candidatus Termiticorpusculum sp.]MCL2292551.1 helix-turn-helix domain-containing protein [Candidatus Termiticorpusculum sp.]MDR0461418.1 helix-turn-helix domain-containing protein [Nitrososphaerota archaeon]
MEKKRLLQNSKNKNQETKEINILQKPQDLKAILGNQSWKILTTISEKEMYPLEIARRLNIHEQKVYYHIRKMEKAGAITIQYEENKKGATAKYYKTTATAFGIELPVNQQQQQQGKSIQNNYYTPNIPEKLQKFFQEFLNNETLNGKIIVGSPQPHGPFKTSARDGHYAAHLTLFMGQFAKIPNDFAVKLDVDVKAEKEEKNSLILVGGPGTNLLTQEINKHLPIKFIMHPSEQGYLFGGLTSEKTGRKYTSDSAGIIAKITNPWNKDKHIIVIAGNKAVGTKACVLALTNFWEKTLQPFNADKNTFAVVIQGFDLDGDGKVDAIEVYE